MLKILYLIRLFSFKLFAVDVSVRAATRARTALRTLMTVRHTSVRTARRAKMDSTVTAASVGGAMPGGSVRSHPFPPSSIIRRASVRTTTARTELSVSSLWVHPKTAVDVLQV